NQPAVRVRRAMSRLYAGETAKAVAEAEELTRASNWSGEEWFNVACFYALASTKVADKKQEYADRAMAFLREAVQAGYKNAARLSKESWLNALRQREDFQKLLAELKAGKK